MKTNPFTPNFGQVPMYIAGRTDIIEDLSRYLDNPTMGNPLRSTILIGPRGAGKTALLSYFSDIAMENGWISVNTICIPGMQEDILQQLYNVAVEHISDKKTKSVVGVSIGNILGVEWENTKPNSKNWRSKMNEILDVLNSKGIGLFLTIDEVTPKLDEMIQVASIYQLFVREGRNVALLMAGLPSEISSLVSDKSVSFLRRASQFELENIEDYEIKNALYETITESGKKIDDKTLDAGVKAIEGFPYMLQLVGYRAWEASNGAKEITLTSMNKGIELAKKDFESRVLKATINELSDADIAFLKAMLPDESESAVSDIEARLNKTSGHVSKYRIRLISQGVIESKRRGIVSFSIPGLREYMEEKM